MRAKPEIGMYWPAAQDANPSGMWYYVRTWGAPDATMGMIRQTVQRMDSKLVVASLGTLDAAINDNINDDRMIALLAESFGVLAMLLAAVGLYGVLAYATAQRTREIGVRMALGSDRSGVVALVLKDVLKLAGISVLVALPVALLATRGLKSQLFGVSNLDPLVVVPVTLLVLLVALLAAVLPARRAAKVEPMQALRME
jgi:ABC-type antimicrobial peptide transport system permease subunit